MNEFIISENLFTDICRIIDFAKQKTASAFNQNLTLMYWNIGSRINTEVLGNKRAEYGKQILETLAQELKETFPSMDFSTRNLRRMMQFASGCSDFQIVSTLSAQLSWSHFVEILPVKEDLQREFYLTMAASERWSVRTLREKINGMLYERTLISGKPEEFVKQELSNLRENDVLTPDLVFKSPYFLDFTGLKGFYNERNLEEMLLSGLQQFILELGNGFTFVERQKRMIIDGEDFYLDLLFYHRKLHRLIAVELKRGRFRAEYKGQMELYLRWLDRYEKQPGEESPLGLLLCSEGGDEQIELLRLDQAGIQVSQYYTELPAKELLREQLRKQVIEAQARFEKFLKFEKEE
ncbi:MAG: DUF1016 family protein [Thermoguttaceae bacterium]|nr:DUF1016 family protein [Thermoguttaceae bacterium]